MYFSALIKSPELYNAENSRKESYTSVFCASIRFNVRQINTNDIRKILFIMLNGSIENGKSQFQKKKSDIKKKHPLLIWMLCLKGDYLC
ncbi:MAG: hypothetical protein A2Y71_05510 [Bacteroidetes bacterium RBG_13_42_15]|nr:MAG: hypothetical protein A2Y71_05510 [Bacteroidetes bacterium RBG_13_42_15]